MHNDSLVQDYLTRAKKRIKAVEALQKEEAWADVVRESQEIVELALKALLRSAGIEVPRVHDVSSAIDENRSRLPKFLKADDINKMMEISRSLRRDRELAFYGSEDLTPSEFYRRSDADKAYDWILFVVDKLKPLLK